MTKKSKQTALVTGGAGFIGSHMCDALLQRGYQVTCLDDFSTGNKQNISGMTDLKVMEGDVNNPDTFKCLNGKKFDVLFHYAATVGVRRTEEQPFSVLDDVYGLNNIIDFAKRGGSKKIIFASSSEVYANLHNIPMREEDGRIGWSPYTVVKLYGEQVLKALWQKYKIPTISLRFFNVYGPRQAGNGYGFVVAKFIQQALHDVAPTVYGDGQQTRDFVYINDNISATLAVAERKEAFGEVVNIGTGKETKIIDLADTIIAGTGKENILQPVFIPGRPFEIPRRCASTKKMSRLKLKCSTSLNKGIKETLAWYGLESVQKTIPVFGDINKQPAFRDSEA